MSTPQTGRRNRTRRFFRPSTTLLIGLALALPLLACEEPEYRSVHFHQSVYFHQDRPDFVQMPQPWLGAPAERRALADYNQEEDPGGQRRARKLKQALRLERAGQFQQAAATWQQFLQDRLRADPWELEAEDRDPPPQAQGLEDRLAALRAWHSPRDTTPLRVYLRARDRVNAGRYQTALALLAGLTHEPYRTHAEYLRASIQFRRCPPEGAVPSFEALLKRHPDHVQCLYMIGRCYLTAVRVADEATPRVLSPAARRSYLLRARAAYEKCAAVDPRGPLAEDARGKAAACIFRLGDLPEALLRYCRQLAALPPGRDNHYAFLSARQCLRRMELAEHQRFQARAAREPEVAAVYLDLHLHFGRPGVRACGNLGRFALAVLARRPRAPLSGRLLARLAVIEGRLGRWERALRLAAAAIERCPPGAYRDQARWQRALALQRLGRRREALAEYERLAAEARVPNLRRGAHEAAAVLSEQGGDLPNALRHYFALDYLRDYAYLIDCAATQHDLRDFLRRFPHHPKAPLTHYSLGYRQLRAGQYEAAARTFASLGPWVDRTEREFNANHQYRWEMAEGDPRWSPLRLARFLADAARREASAPTHASKARWAYARAAALFHQRYLALYNAPLWQGSRLGTLDFLGPESPMKDLQAGPVSIDQNGIGPWSPRDQEHLDRHEREHACLYQALLIFERIAREYPDAPEAPKALCSAAHCYEWLDHMDHYWTVHAKYSGRSEWIYREILRRYPEYPLLRSAAKQSRRAPSSGCGPQS
jgi:TolA-binding protein